MYDSIFTVNTYRKSLVQLFFSEKIFGRGQKHRSAMVLTVVKLQQFEENNAVNGAGIHTIFVD